jgi:peptidoglycan/xylan/chitin deacetylase (PgdA/CDA1 family)
MLKLLKKLKRKYKPKALQSIPRLLSLNSSDSSLFNWKRNLKKIIDSSVYERYVVKTKNQTKETIENRCRSVSDDYQKLGLVNSFSLFQELIKALIDCTHLEIRPLKKLLDPLIDKNQSVLSIRVDMDTDISYGLRMARYCARYGIPATFFILHNSWYYGEVKDKIFYRYSGMADYVRDFIVTGCELGLHTDALGLYGQYGVDGAEAVRTEVAWLRQQGAKIEGTVAHNSAPLYGAENFEVFKGRALDNRQSIMVQEKSIPLQVLSEVDLGLSYEGNFPVLPKVLDHTALNRFLAPAPTDAVRSYDWLKTYLVDNPVFSRGYDYDIWLLGKDLWAIAPHVETEPFEYPVASSRVFEFLASVKPGQRIVITLHPIYLSGELDELASA